MQEEGWARRAPLGGIAFVVLYAVAIALFAGFPESSASAEEFAAYYTDDRGTYIAGSLLAIAAFGFFIWFTAGLVSRLRNAGEHGRSTVVVLGCGAYVGASLVSIGLGLGLVASEAAREVDPTFLKGIEAASDGIWILAWLPLAALVLAYGTAAARSGTAPGWFGASSVLAAVLLALGTTTWAESGFWSPFGDYVLVIAAAILLWPLTASILALRASGRPEAGLPVSRGGETG